MAPKPISLSALEKVGRDLHRPEDVSVGVDGRVFASDRDAGVAEILPDGSARRIGAKRGAPNGINFDGQGRILIANFGLEAGEPGPLERLDLETGAREILVAEVEGRPLVASNYPLADRAGNLWCSHSTSKESFTAAAREGCDDGFIYVLRTDGSCSVVAEGLAFANGLAFSPDERFLFCAQTMASDVLRYPVLDGARLGPGERYGPRLGAVREPGAGRVDPLDLGYTDGVGFDAEGNLWVTLVLANKVVAITPGGDVVTVIEDRDGAVMRNPTNVTWAGDDGRDLYIGSVTTPYVLKTRTEVPGARLG